MSIDLKEWKTLDFDCRTDEDIVEAVREGESEALEYLINKYKNFVRAKARSYFLIGADREDIVQEGMIGLIQSNPRFQRRQAGILQGVCRALYNPPNYYRY